MAKRGDMVECPCGDVLKLENDRFPWHKRLGSRFNCQFAGSPAESRDPVVAVSVGSNKVALACPECRGRGVKKQGNMLVCTSCGTAGTIVEFAQSSLGKIQRAGLFGEAPVPKRRHRYMDTETAD